jgi:hypothetical protein
LSSGDSGKPPNQNTGFNTGERSKPGMSPAVPSAGISFPGFGFTNPEWVSARDSILLEWKKAPEIGANPTSGCPSHQNHHGMEEVDRILTLNHN